MTPNGFGTIQGMNPEIDVKAVKKETEEALLKIFKKHKVNWHEARFFLDKVIDISELM